MEQGKEQGMPGNSVKAGRIHSGTNKLATGKQFETDGAYKNEVTG